MRSILLQILDPITVAVFLGVLGICWILFPKKTYRLPPGPFNWPIIGCTIGLMWNKHGKKQFLQSVDWSKKYGAIFYMNTVMGKIVVLNEIEVAMEALVTKSTETAGRLYIYAADMVTDGGKDIIFTDYSENVKYMRRITGSALRNLLTGGRLETITHLSVIKGLEAFEQKAKSTEAFDPKPLLSSVVYNVVSRLCFNVDFDLEDPDFQALFRLNTEASSEFASGFHLADLFPPARYLPPTPSIRRLMDVMKGVSAAVMKFIKKHEENFDPDNIKDFIDHMIKIRGETEDGGENSKNIVLDSLHYKQIIFDIFAAGTDTTSNTLLFIVFLLTHNPDVQRKVQKEIDEVVDSSRLPSVADKANMPYCEAVMYECMRFGTIVPLGVPHKAMCDLELGGYEIPKGTNIMINHYALHRDPKVWKNPEDFNPDRFLDKDGTLLPKPESFLPFGAGKRVCLGEAIAKPEIFMIFTALFQKFNYKFGNGYGGEMKFKDWALNFLPEPFRVVAELR